MVNMTSPGRYQGPDLNLNPSLQPAPVVQGVMVQPKNRDGAGSSLMQIAQSLSDLGAPLSQFSQVLVAQRQKEQQQQAQADQYLPQSVIQANIMNDPKKYGNQYYTAMAGRAAANNIGPLIDQWTNEEWDSTKESYRDFLYRKAQEHQAALPTDEAKAAFGEAVTPWIERAYGNYQQTVTQTAEMNRDNVIFTDYNGLIERGKLDKKSPDQIWKDIVTASNENRLFLNLPGANQNAILLSLAEKVAESGDVDMVKAILNGTRGADGKVPALSTIPDLLPKVEAITQKAENVYRQNNVNGALSAQSELNDMVAKGATDEEFKAWAAKHNDILTPDQVVRGYQDLQVGRDKVRMNNQWAADKQTQMTAIDAQINEVLAKGEGWKKFPTVPVMGDKPGNANVQLDVDKRVDQLVNEKVNGVYQSLPPEVADVEAAKFLAANNRTYQGWTSVFDAVSPAAIKTAAEEGKVSPQLTRAVELYTRLSGSYGGILGKHITGKGTQEFLDGVDFLLQEGIAKSTDEAIMLASRNTFSPDGDARRASVQQEVSRAMFSDTLPDGNLDKYTKVKKIAESLAMATGVPASKALEKAQEIYDKNYVEVLGTPIPRNDKRVPQNIDEIMSSYAEDWVTNHGADMEPPITDASELGVMWSEGRLILTDQDGLPIRLPAGREMNAPGDGLQVISMSDATNYWSYKQKVAAGEAAAQIVEDANKGWFFGLFGGADPNAPAPNTTPGTAQNMYGITSVDQVKTLNYAQLTEVQKAINAGKLDKTVGGKDFIDAILAEIKRRDDEAMQKVKAMQFALP